MTQAPNSQELDEHLGEVVQALHGAVRQAMSHLNDSGRADQAIRDCREILDEVLAGKTAEWLNQRLTCAPRMAQKLIDLYDKLDNKVARAERESKS